MQPLQSDWPVALVMEPGEHGDGSVEPVEHAEPAGHGVHPASLARPGLFEKDPAGHGNAAAAPSAQYAPAVQTAHVV